METNVGSDLHCPLKKAYKVDLENFWGFFNNANSNIFLDYFLLI